MMAPQDERVNGGALPPVMSPRRFGAAPRAELEGARAAAVLAQPVASGVVAVRLTAKELKEPLGRCPIKGTGAARFGIMLDSISSPGATSRAAGMSTPRGESVSALLHQPQALSPVSTGRSGGSDAYASHTDSPRSQVVIRAHADGHLSPRAAMMQQSRATTFSALPGGPESANTHRFGHVISSTDTARSILSPRAGAEHCAPSVVPSPARTRSKRFGHNDTNGGVIAPITRADPAQLPAPAGSPTREGRQAGAALPSVKSRDSVKNIISGSAGDREDELVGPSSGKITARAAPRREDGRLIPVVGLPTVNPPPAGMSPPLTSARSLTDARNFGDEPSAGALINERDATLVTSMLTAKTMTSPEQAEEWAERFSITAREARHAFDVAQAELGVDGAISLKDFKDVVNALY